MKTSGTDKRQQHHGRLAGKEGVGRTGSHVEPRPGPQLEWFAVNGEAEPSGQDLNHGSAARLMLGEPVARVEAEHGDVHPVASMYDLGDNGARLDDHFAGRIGDQRIGHRRIIVPACPDRQPPGETLAGPWRRCVRRLVLLVAERGVSGVGVLDRSHHVAVKTTDRRPHDN